MSEEVRSLGERLSGAVLERREEFIEAGEAELGFSRADIEIDVDWSAAYLARKLSEEAEALAAGRPPICAAGGEVALMLPSNITAYPTVEIGRALAVGNPVRARLSSRAKRLAELVQQVFDQVAPGRVRIDRELSGREFLAETIEGEGYPLVMIWGGESLGDDLLERVRSAPAKRVVFEGPGKDPAIILAGVDVAAVAADLIEAKFAVAGQSCTAPENLILHRSVHDTIVGRLIDACWEQDPQPMYSTQVPKIVAEQLADAGRLGAKIEIGGSVEGQTVAPTVVTGVTPEMRLFQDETFAPVFAVSGFEEREEAIALARGTRYGLRAAVVGEEAESVAAELRGADYAEPVEDIVYGRYGLVSVGRIGDDGEHAAFGGYGKSGWVWDSGRLYQGPKAILREATVGADPGLGGEGGGRR
jgi:acyl-CoA reductase-like NAD-dependent aldehyde dehydrogenase